MNWLDLLAVKGTLKSLLQYHSSKASILQPSDFFCFSFFFSFIFFPFIFISWRLITLQYCSGFCHTLTWISHGWNQIWKRHVHPNVHCSTIYNSQDMEATSDFFIVQLSHPYMTTGKTKALPRWTFVGKVISLLFNMLSGLVIAFLPWSVF